MSASEHNPMSWFQMGQCQWHVDVWLMLNDESLPGARPGHSMGKSHSLYEEAAEDREELGQLA